MGWEVDVDEVVLPEAMTRFQCNQKGCCCAGWRIPMDASEVIRISNRFPAKRRFALLDGAHLIHDNQKRLVLIDLSKRDDGRCAFLMNDRRCELHADFGPESLPSLCKSFPAAARRVQGKLRLSWDPICPEVLERIDESDAPYEIAVANLADSPSLAFRCASPRTVPTPMIAGREVQADELATIESGVLALLGGSERPAVDQLALINVAVTDYLDGGASNWHLDPGAPVPTDFAGFFESCVHAHDARILASSLRDYRRFIHAIDVADVPLEDFERHLSADDWREVLDPYEPKLQPLDAPLPGASLRESVRAVAGHGHVGDQLCQHQPHLCHGSPLFRGTRARHAASGRSDVAESRVGRFRVGSFER